MKKAFEQLKLPHMACFFFPGHIGGLAGLFFFVAAGLLVINPELSLGGSNFWLAILVWFSVFMLEEWSLVVRYRTFALFLVGLLFMLGCRFFLNEWLKHQDMENYVWPNKVFWLINLSFLFFAFRFFQVAATDLGHTAFGRFFIPFCFGGLVLYYWELITVGFQVPSVLLPSPSVIYQTFIGNLPILWADFRQTFLKSVLVGYALGSATGFLFALAIDRFEILKQGILPVGNFISSLPIVGIAPIMVMWFGFDWQSKAAVVVLMTIFPMLVNTLSGLGQTERLELDLLKTYNPSYITTLLKVRLHQASPFIFNALKLNSTLAIIGAIVAEFFGTPIVGVGFRISTEVGRLNLAFVWASILVSAVTGSLVYGLISYLDQRVNFWHSSVQKRSL